MVKSVAEEPTIDLEHWHLVYHEGIGYRLVGVTPGRMRISSPIVELDVAAGQAVTESGRVYRLIGEPHEAMAERIVRAYRVRHMLPPGELRVADVGEFEVSPGRRFN
jgi:hypothetical protein